MKLDRNLSWKYKLLFLFIAFGYTIPKVTPYLFDEISHLPPMPTSVSNPVTKEGVDLGRNLFYDPILSLDSSMSCASCHKQSKAFSDGGNKFSIGVAGVESLRNTPALFNLAWYSNMFWDGRASSIEEQVFDPVRNHLEMNLDWKIAEKRVGNNKRYKKLFKKAFGNVSIDSVLIAKSIAQFERTLISANSKYDQVIRGERYFTPAEYNGFLLMNNMTKGSCLHCHTTDANGLGTTLIFSNNGLDSITDISEFNDQGRGATTGIQGQIGTFKIPSVRNLAFTAPYMHDGRFSTLDEVLDFYSTGVKISPTIDSKMERAHVGGVRLSESEKSDIIAFLLTMSDSSFVENEKFSNPF